MTNLPNQIRQSDLIYQLVLDRHTLKELGRVEVMWTYPPMHRVLGFICKSGFLGGQKAAFKLAQIYALGSDGLLTEGQPDETDSDRVSKLESLLHYEVWSETGSKVGKIIDYLFNPHTGYVTNYLVIGDRFLDNIYCLSPAHMISFGSQRVLVREAAIDTWPIYRKGVPQKLSEVTALLDDLSIDIQALGQTTTQQAKLRWRDLSQQAKELASPLAQQARETIQILNEQLQEAAQAAEDEPFQPATDKTQAIDSDPVPNKKANDVKAANSVTANDWDVDSLWDDLPPTLSSQPPFTQPAPKPTPTATVSNSQNDDEPWV
jgi:uncharacterized protein YrrD